MEHARIVVIGGGIAGCSTLYHLTKEGLTDCLLLERDELTSGTTWHSAAQVTNFGPNQTMVGLKTHSINLYRELADDPEYPINYHHATGGLRLASTQDHLDGYHHFASMAKGMGVDFEVLDAEECRKRHPLITTDNLLGALWDPLDGDIDPAQLCQALARRARNAGARVERHRPVTGLTQKPDHSWIVHTAKGDIACEIIINAGGYRCNEIGAMMGVELPVASMEHQYMLTEPIAEIEALDFRLPLIRCPTADFYQRQEKNGLLIGFYEQECKTWGLDGIPDSFTMALCPDDLDRVMPVMEAAFARLPCLETTGIHTVINGPITYTPDGLPLVGAIPGKRNAFCITGLRAGLGEGGGHGWLLAQIIAHGEAIYDTWCLDPRRFTQHATVKYTALKAIEDYQNEFRFHMPHEFRPAGRSAKMTPLTETLIGQGAEMGVVNGWERAQFFKPDPAFYETHSFRFTDAEAIVADEVRAVQQSVGIMEVSGFNRYELRGEGLHDWLETVMCSRIPRKPGKVGLAYFLNDAGCIKGECTLANLPGGRVWYGSAAAAEYHDRDWLDALLPDDGSITIESLTNDTTTLVVAGPRSRDVMARACNFDDWSVEAFPWLSARPVQLHDLSVLVMSVSYSGELAYEVHVGNAHLEKAYAALLKAGAPFGIRPFGARAAEAMRLEKGYRHWKADLITEFDPYESDLPRFVRKDDRFVGAQALRARQANGPTKSFVTLVIDDETAPAHAGDSIMRGDRVVGTVTSAAWGHRVGKNLALAFVDPDCAEMGTQLGLLRLGEVVPAAVSEACLYDPENLHVRSR